MTIVLRHCVAACRDPFLIPARESVGVEAIDANWRDATRFGSQHDFPPDLSHHAAPARISQYVCHRVIGERRCGEQPAVSDLAPQQTQYVVGRLDSLIEAFQQRDVVLDARRDRAARLADENAPPPTIVNDTRLDVIGREIDEREQHAVRTDFNRDRQTRMYDVAQAGRVPVISAMGNLPIVKDLVVDMGPFWEKFKSVDPYLQPGYEEPPDGREYRIDQQRISPGTRQIGADRSPDSTHTPDHQVFHSIPHRAGASTPLSFSKPINRSATSSCPFGVQ